MKLLNLKLLFGLFFFLLLVRPTFAQQQYFFQEEFNEERPPQILNPDKWIVYPNRNPQPDYQGCLVDTVRETGGILLLKQCSTKNQFPYVVSKNNPFPQGNFTAETRLQFTTAGALSTGIHFADTAPENGAGFTSLFTISFEEDGFSGLAMRIEYKDQPVYTKQTNTAYHLFKVTSEDNIYKLYFDNQLVFTSPPTAEKVKVVFIGTPAILPSPGYPWAWPRIDYIRITDDGPSEIAPTPFLVLPWNYGDKDFKQIVFNPNAWFDHKYPLQNIPCCTKNIVNYKGLVAENYYSSHSGYDFGSPHGVIKDTEVLAAAAGKAVFIPEADSGGAGNMIKIDHGNGYQTWYEHLEENSDTDQLIVDEVGEEADVTKGQKIGRVGLTGNTTGYHIHLSVFKDIDGNGDFSNDHPYGLVDPLGWEGDYTDPWEEYSNADNTKHGAKSYKLFTDLTPPKIQQLSPSGGTLISDKFTLTVPENASSATLIYKVADGPFEKSNDTNKSIVPSLFLSAANNLGEAITSFNNPLGLIYDYSKADLSNINEDTLSFYFFNPQTSLWEKITSSLNKNNKTISSQTTHFSQFAVMGEILDSIPPTTTAQITGDKGTGSWYRSDVKVQLLAQDNPGGKGPSYTVYSFTGKDWDEYSGPVELTTEGPHKIYFLSHDLAGNEESIKTIEFSIDKTIPEAKIEVDKSDWDLRITPVATDSAQITKTPGINNKATYTLTDPAGNTLTLETYDLDTKYIDVFKLLSLKYNNDPKLPQPENIFDTNYLFLTPRNKPETKIVNQNFILKDKAVYVITADLLKNKTILNIIENRNYRKEEKPGVVLLKLQTNKGKLEYTPQ